jgi:nucleoside-diphosphate-sugar epimerase
MRRAALLVAGKSGFVGRASCIGLEEAGWIMTECVRLGRRSGRKSGELDLSDLASVTNLGEAGAYDAIVHLDAHAGLSDVAEHEMFAPNVLASGQLAYLIKAWDEDLVFASTAVAHGGKPAANPPTSPLNADTCTLGRYGSPNN